MKDFTNTKWDQSDWTKEQKIKWQEKCFELGFMWCSGTSEVQHLDNYFFQLWYDHDITRSSHTSLTAFEKDEKTQMYWEDMFPEEETTSLFAKEELTPINKKEEMLVMALLRKCRGEEVEFEYANGRFIKSIATGSVDLCKQYRKPVKKLDIPWEIIKPKFKYAAMDNDGDVCVYTEEPTLKGAVWSNIGCDNYTECFSDIISVDTTGINWKESLIKRPEGV